MPEPFDVPADGEDIYRYFVTPPGFVEDKVVTALELWIGFLPDKLADRQRIVSASERSWYRSAQVSDVEIARLLERLPSLE